LISIVIILTDKKNISLIDKNIMTGKEKYFKSRRRKL